MDKRHLLILDLDETLVHATNRPLPRAPDFEVPPYALYLRPGVGEFLDWALATFKVAVWTSSSPKYAEIVTSLLFEDLSKLEFVWARDRCTPRRDFERDVWWDSKPLHKVRRRGFDLRRVLAVDDNPEKYTRSYGNLVAVSPYRGSLDDDELPYLRRYLEQLAMHPNVRSVEKRFWRHRLEEDEKSGPEGGLADRWAMSTPNPMRTSPSIILKTPRCNMSLIDPSNRYFPEAFLTPGVRAKATHELASYREAALPLLLAILDGSAVNENGVPYRRLGMPIDCALVTIQMLGKIAFPLQHLVQAEVERGHPYARDALTALS